MGGRGGMITTPISLQDLRRRIYVMAKADKTNRGFAGRGGVRRGSMNGSGSSETTGSAIGLRTKALLVDRSHNPWREADRRAAYGKSRLRRSMRRGLETDPRRDPARPRPHEWTTPADCLS